MSVPILVREMLPEDRAMVLSDWKRGLHDQDPPPDWRGSLRWDEWWSLINHVIDRITLPSCTVWMACHRDEPAIPLCWLASRAGLTLHTYARISVREDPELAAFLERALTEHAATMPSTFNPFHELKRP